MTLFTTLLVLIVERLFKLGEHWQLDHRLEALFRRITHFSMLRTMGMTAIAMVVTFLLLQALKGLLFNVPTLVVWILLGVLCIGAGKVRVHYHAWLKAASRNDPHPCEAMASELTLIHGVPPDCNEREFLRELQNALLWINFRFLPRTAILVYRWRSMGAGNAGGLCVFTGLGRLGWRAIRRRTNVCNPALTLFFMCWTGFRYVWRA